MTAGNTDPDYVKPVPHALAVIQAVKDSYRTYCWEDQDEYVEVMIEKEALAGMLEPVTCQFRVSLCR